MDSGKSAHSTCDFLTDHFFDIIVSIASNLLTLLGCLFLELTEGIFSYINKSLLGCASGISLFSLVVDRPKTISSGPLFSRIFFIHLPKSCLPLGDQTAHGQQCRCHAAPAVYVCLYLFLRASVHFVICLMV